jgi:hypothetical protein
MTVFSFVRAQGKTVHPGRATLLTFRRAHRRTCKCLLLSPALSLLYDSRESTCTQCSQPKTAKGPSWLARCFAELPLRSMPHWHRPNAELRTPFLKDQVRTSFVSLLEKTQGLRCSHPPAVLLENSMEATERLVVGEQELYFMKCALDQVVAHNPTIA